MYQHYLTTSDGRVLHLNRITGVMKDGDGRVCNGNTEGYIANGKYKRMVIGTHRELCYQPLNRMQIEEV